MTFLSFHPIEYKFDDTEQILGTAGTISLNDRNVTSTWIDSNFENTQYNAKATPAESYEFVGWAEIANTSNMPFGNWTISDTAATKTFTLDHQPMNIGAVFQKNLHG